jgi:hypothetical protein
MNIFDTLASKLDGTILPKPSSRNQRAYADLVEEHAVSLAQTEYAAQFAPARSVRSPEDFAIKDNCTHYIDVKTRQLGTDFNMPNLISVDRLDKLLSEPDLELWYWMIDYEVDQQGQCIVRHSEIRTVWSLPWTALSIQNLGKGQLQISNWSLINSPSIDRDSWHQELRVRRRAFYLKQALKFQRLAQQIQP